MTARQAMERLRRLNVSSAVQVAIENTKEQYLELQREQMAAGKQQTGDEIQLSPMEWFPGYSPAYKARREHMGLQTEHVDLDRSGEFYAEMELTTEAGKVNITSKAEYEEWITKRFKGKIWGLGGKYLAQYKELYLQPAMALAVAEQSGL